MGSKREIHLSDIQNKVNQSIDEEDYAEKKYSKDNEKNSDEQK